MIKELDYQTRAVDELVEQCAQLLQSGGERKKLVHNVSWANRRSCGSRRTSCTSRAETKKEQP